MRNKLFAATALLVAASLTPRAQADVVGLNFNGAGMSGSVTLTYGPDNVAGDPAGAYTVTGATGTFSDSNIGIYNVAITGLVPSSPATPLDPLDTDAPASFGFFYVANGVPVAGSSPSPGLTYDDLIYPGGAPQTAYDFPFTGGLFDVYGLMLTIANGDVVNFWGDGNFGAGGAQAYGMGVANATSLMDYSFSGVTVPEPGSAGLFGLGLLGLLAWRSRSGTVAPLTQPEG
jgi:hypothetical protein